MRGICAKVSKSSRCRDAAAALSVVYLNSDSLFSGVWWILEQRVVGCARRWWMHI